MFLKIILMNILLQYKDNLVNKKYVIHRLYIFGCGKLVAFFY